MRFSFIYGAMQEHHHTLQEYFSEGAETKDYPEERGQLQQTHSTLSNSPLVLPLRHGYRNTKGCLMVNYSITLASLLTTVYSP